MLASDLILSDFPYLRLDDSVSQALDYMDEFKVSHLAVVKDNKLIGLINEEVILSPDSNDKKMSDFVDDFERLRVLDHEHVFEVVGRVSDFEVSVVPIVNEHGRFLGSVTTNQLMTFIADMPVVKSPGSIIVLEMGFNDYSMTEISNIIESNDAKILGSFITRNPDSMKIELTIKVNKSDVQGILQTFERYKYTITASYDKSEVNDNLTNRYDNLMNFINI